MGNVPKRSLFHWTFYIKGLTSVRRILQHCLFFVFILQTKIQYLMALVKSEIYVSNLFHSSSKGTGDSVKF